MKQSKGLRSTQGKSPAKVQQIVLGSVCTEHSPSDPREPPRGMRCGLQSPLTAVQQPSITHLPCNGSMTLAKGSH